MAVLLFKLDARVFVGGLPIPSKHINSVKLALLALFIIGANIEAQFLYRVELLIHNFGGYKGAFIFLLIWLVSIISLVTAAFLKLPSTRIFLAFVFSVPTGIGLTYELISGTFLTYDSLAIMLDAADHTGDAILFYWSQTLIAVLIATLGFLSIALTPRYGVNNVSNIVRPNLLLYLPVIALPFFLILTISLLRGGGGTDGLPLQYKTASLFFHVLASKVLSPSLTRKSVSIRHDIQPNTPMDIVLIVDESVRGDFLDINVMRGTTPSLMRHVQRIQNFGLASSGANCSSGSNQILRTGATLDNFQSSLMTNPFIWDYAKKAGFSTVYVEAQAKFGRLNNRMSLNEKALIDEFIYTDGDSRFQRDLNAIKVIKNKINDSKKHFIYIVKSGIHFPYESSYPVAASKFRPYMKGGLTVKNREEMVNSYKNAAAWTINRFFHALFDDINLEHSLIIYTSDHGQNLLDNGSVLTHCATSNVAYQEGIVPIFVSTDIPFWEGKFRSASRQFRNQASHFNIFPTLLQLFGYQKEGIGLAHGAGLLEINVPDQRFISGVVSEYRLTLGEHSSLKLNHISKDDIQALSIKPTP